MPKLLATAEKILVLGLGLYMLALAGGDDYTTYMHPKYRWLTTLAGGGLTFLALAAFWFKVETGRPARTVIFTLFFLIVLIYGVKPWSGAGNGSKPEFPVEPDYPPLVDYQGVAHTRINTAELFFLLQEGLPEAWDRPYAVRGLVKKSPELTARHSFALLRVNLVCCAADATAMGVVVKYDQTDRLEDGEWVNVLGRLVLWDDKDPLPRAPSLKDVFYSVVYDRAVLAADLVEPTERPLIPNMFELNAERPYNY